MSEETKVYLLPRNLAKLGNVCDKDPSRYATNNVQVTTDGKTFRAVATDGKCGVIVEGKIGPDESALAYPEKFPDIEKAIPKTDPVLTFDIDPRLLARVLNASLPYTNPQTRRVRVEFYAEDKTIVVRTKSEGGEREFTGLIMPLAKGDL